MPRSPAQLREHEWIMHVPSSQRHRATFHKGARAVTVQMRGRLYCNDGGAAVEACVRGVGVLLVPSFEVAEHMRAGRLVQLVPSWSPGNFLLHAVYPSTRYVPLKLRAFLDAVVAEWRIPPWRLQLAHVEAREPSVEARGSTRELSVEARGSTREQMSKRAGPRANKMKQRGQL